jgi:predicted ATPase
VFAWLAVFRGGCALDAAERVCSASLDQLQSLVDQSLLRRRETPAESRVAMLETIREYALDRLQAADSAERAFRAHADYYLSLAERDADSLHRAEHTTLARHDLELDNFRAAFAWLERNDRQGALGLASALSSYWYTSARLVEGRGWFESVLAQASTPSRELAVVAAELARLLCFLGETETAMQRVERALELADELQLPDVLPDALNTKHLLLYNTGQASEALSLLKRALSIARDDDATGASLPRALYNLAYQMRVRDRLAESQAVDLEGLELSRRSGSKSYEEFFLGHLLESHVRLGEWEAALAVAAELEEDPLPRGTFDRLTSLPWLHVQRGDITRARELVEAYRHLTGSEDLQERLVHSIAEATVLRAEGRLQEALAAAQAALAERESFGPHGEVTFAWVEAVETGFDLDDLERVRRLLGDWEDVTPLEQPSFLEGSRARFTAKLAVRLGDSSAVELALQKATEIFRALSMPFYVAITRLEHAEWLVAQGRAPEASELLAEADAIFRKLDAKPWRERTAGVLATTPAVDSIA